MRRSPSIGAANRSTPIIGRHHDTRWGFDEWTGGKCGARQQRVIVIPWREAKNSGEKCILCHHSTTKTNVHERHTRVSRLCVCVDHFLGRGGVADIFHRMVGTNRGDNGWSGRGARGRHREVARGGAATAPPGPPSQGGQTKWGSFAGAGGRMGCGTHFLKRLAFQGGKRAESRDFREGSIREKRPNVPLWPTLSHGLAGESEK
jgi:hypothetical protein